MNIRYRVELNEGERAELTAMLSGGKHAARKLKRAQILLAADAGVSDEAIASSVSVGGSTVYRTKRRFVEGNLDLALSEEARPGAARKLSGKETALLVATACSSPPAGRKRWTLDLLAGEMAQLTEHEGLSRETVRRRIELPAEQPQNANVIGWNALLFDHFCPGENNKELRQYLKATTERAWQLVNWLTHHRNANKTAALIAKYAVDAIVVHMVHLLNRERHDRTEQCPRCASRKRHTYYDLAIEPDGAYFGTCGECGWSSHPGYEDDTDRDPIEICEAQLDHAMAEHEAWIRTRNESMVEFSAHLVGSIERQLTKLRAESDRQD